MISKILAAFTLGLFITTATAHAEDSNAFGIRLEDYEYPFPVKLFRFKAQEQSLEMAYMDAQPAEANGETVLLLHGKNFCGAYWGRTAKDLSERGYRVIVPDQIGFGKSSKPANYHYTFQSLATNTQHLLNELGVGKIHVLGHSMGGMIATRFALMYPESTRSLILENPIGLEDWKTMVPYPGIDQWYEKELQVSAESIRKYQQESYYDGQWKPEYDPWVEILAGVAKSEGYQRVAWNQALTYDMIFTQPVVYEFPLVKAPTLLIIGQRDRTALGKASVPKKVSEKMGLYPELGRKTAEAIPNSQLVEIEGIGHLPHIEAYEKFITPLMEFLDSK